MQRKKRKLIAMPVVAVIIAIFFIAGTASVFAAADKFDAYTVQGKNPQGTVVSLFDYWVNTQDSVDFRDGSPYQNSNGGINKGHTLKFSKGIGDGFNNWTGGETPYFNMVENTLGSNGFPTLRTSFSNGVFYPESLAYLFDQNDSTSEGSAKVEGKKAYNNVEGLMQVDDDGYYYYDCAKNFASYDSDTNSMKLYQKPGVYDDGHFGQFFPFNKASDVFSVGSGLTQNRVYARSNSVNHWFGMSMSTHFMQSTNGTTNRGKDVTYEFSGDDDVWVFIDGVLVGDLGGTHNSARLKINFKTGEIYINDEQNGTLKSKYEDAGKEGETQWKGNTFADGSYHTLKFFYLERGNYASNMSLKFNLKLMPDNELSKVDQYGSTVSGATFDLYEAEKKNGKYTKKGSRSLCTGTTDTAGGLKLKAADGAIINFEELYKKGIGPYYILEESQTPAGYRKTKDIWLQYDSKTGAITTDNMWDTGVHANPRIMITAPTHMYDRNGKRITESDGTLSNGSVFAVVYKRNDMETGIGVNSNWSAISGSVLKGWNLQPVSSNNEMEDVLKGNRYELKMNSMGAYETTLDELPGDIMTYSNVIVADNAGKSSSELQKALNDKARYSISYYYTSGSVEDATASNTVRLDTGIMSQNPSAREFEYKYAVKLIVTDVSNDLYVRKFDEYSTGFNNQEHSVDGVKFALYKEDQTTWLSRLLGNVQLKDDAIPVQEKTTDTIRSSQGSIDLYGTAIFRKLENGTYYLKEISAPSGYKVKDNLIKVKVTDNGAFADAGEKGDGIYVGRGGSGTLLKSMEQFATNDDLDSTLTNMKINLRVSENEPNDDGTWDEEVSTAHQDPLHIKYTGLGEYSHVGHYKVYDSEANTTDELLNHMAFFTTDTGWPSVTLQQCQEHSSGNDKSTKTNLGDMDLSHLLVLESMVMVKDDTIGDLEISKTVKNDSSDISFTGSEFKFNVKFWETTKDNDGKETKKPVSGTFKYVVKGPGADDSETRELEVNGEGNGTLQLKDGQTAVIKDLPASAKYEVTEDLGDQTYWDVKSSVDGAEAADAKTVSGVIPEPDDNGNKQKSTVAYENTYSPAEATLNLPVEKKFNGWKLPGLKNREFSIRLTGLESTGEDIQNTMPDAVQDQQDNKWSTTISLGSGRSFTDSNGDVDTTEYLTRNAEFSGLTFHKAGQYTYTIQEILVNDADINYSSALYEVLVNVEDDRAGHLKASYTMKKAREDDGTADDPAAVTDGTATFVNKYNLKTDVISLRAHKTYSNDTGSDTLTDGQFHFVLEAVTEDAPMPKSAADGKVTAAANADGSVGFPEITYTTKEQGESFVYKISEVIPNGATDGKYQGTQYDQDVYYVQITVRGAGGAGVQSDVQYFINYDTKTGKCSDEITPGKDANHFFKVEDNVYRLWFHNSYTAEPAIAEIQGSKTLNGRAMNAGEFSFTMEAANDATAAALTDGSIKASQDGMTAKSPEAADGTAGSFFLPNLTFHKVGTYTFNVTESIPQDVKNNILNGVTYDTNVSTVTVTVTDKDTNNQKTGKLTATVSYENSSRDSEALAEFINSYEESGSYEIAGTKNISGRDFAEGDSFTFTVTPKDGAPAPKDKDGNEIKQVTITPNSGNSAEIDFGSVNFTKAGQSYEYTLKEVKPDDTKGIDYDETSYTLKLTAKSNDPQDGKLTVEKTLTAGNADADAIVWNNAYHTEGALQLEGSKTLRGRSWNDDDSFTFTLWAKAEDKERLDAALDGEAYEEKDGKLIFKTVTVTKKNVTDGAAAIDFGNIKFKQASGDAPFTFYITESVPDGAADGVFEGIAYDSADHEIPVYVTDDGAGKLTATVPDSSKSNLNFTNIYTSSIAYSTHAGLVIQKTLYGHDMEDGQFTFDVKALAGTNTTAADSAYKLGISRDETEKQVTSTAALDGETSTIDVMNGEVKFDQGDVGKTFRCEISEVQDKNAKGYTYDTNVYQVSAEITDNAKGEITVVTTVKNKATGEKVSETTVRSSDDLSQEKPIAIVPFDNHYSASGALDGSGSAKINATKTLTGRAMKAGEFTFHVTNAKDPQKTVLLTGTNKAAADGNAGDVDFAGKIEYTTESLKKDVADGLAVKEDGKYIYQYEVSEAIDKLPAGVSAEEAAFTITVEVTDNGDGTLTAAVQYPNDSKNLAFENVYDTSSEMIPIKGVKTLNNVNGGNLSIGDIEGKYEFSLTGKETTSGVDADAPVPVLNGKKMTKASNDATGEIDFGHIKLEASDFDGITPDEQGIRTRTFEYQITESGKVAGIVNDSEATKTLNLTVKYNGKEKTFVVEGIAEGAAFQFTNTYGVEAVSVDADTLFTVNKKLTGRDLKAGEFQFELLEVSADGEANVIATGTNGAASAGESAAVDFGKITYDQPGEHDYLIREVVPAGGMDANTVYDTRSYSVHVSVKDGGNGTLEVTSDASADKPFTFVNKQQKKPGPNGGDDPSAGGNGNNGGIGGHGTKTGDTSPLAIAILLMLASACAATLVLGLRRERVR